MAIEPNRSDLACARFARKLNPLVGGIISMTVVVPPIASARVQTFMAAVKLPTTLVAPPM